MSAKIASITQFRANAVENQIAALIAKFGPIMHDKLVLEQWSADPTKVTNLIQSRERLMQAEMDLHDVIKRGSAMLVELDDDAKYRLHQLIDVLISLRKVMNRLLTETDVVIKKIGERDQ